MENKKIGLICALAFGAAVLQPNRAEAQSGSQAKLAAAVKEIRTETALTRDQLQQTVDALDVLVKQKTGDLRPTYNTFVAEVKKTYTAAERTGSRGTNMQKASAEYFSAWQADIGGISNESLRKKAQRRLDAVRKSYDKVVESLKEANNEFKPFLSDLDDVQKTLAADVTPGGVKAIRGTASNANFHMKRVRWKIDDALKELDRMAKALSPEANG